MVMPTRFIEKEEFKELIAVEEGNTITIHKLTAIQFQPPLPEGDDWPAVDDYPESLSIRIMLLAVSEPRLYRDERGVTFVVLPSFETLTYEAAQDCLPVKGAYCYRLAPYEWDNRLPLKDAIYVFSTDVPAFDLEDVLTH